MNEVLRQCSGHRHTWFRVLEGLQDRTEIGVRLWRFGSGVQVLGSLGSQFLGLCCQRHVALPEAVVRGELRTDVDVREQDCDLQLRAENSES